MKLHLVSSIIMYNYYKMVTGIMKLQKYIKYSKNIYKKILQLWVL